MAKPKTENPSQQEFIGIPPELTHKDLKWMLQKMYEIRYFEEKAEDLYIRGLVHGTMHLSIGQEASSVGSIATLDPQDLIIHHHRGHGHTIAKGADITLMMAEFLGKERGYCRGRGGSMHIADIEGGNLGATGLGLTEPRRACLSKSESCFLSLDISFDF